jgi:hypothetical protein
LEITVFSFMEKAFSGLFLDLKPTTKPPVKKDENP